MSQGNSTLKWVGIGCGVLLLLGVCCGGGWALIGTQLAGTFQAPASAAKGFFKDLREGNHQHALQRMSGAYQSTHTLPTFQQNVAALPELTQHTDATFTSHNVSGLTATVSGNLTTAQGDVPVTLTLIQDTNEHWYIESVMVRGQSLF